MKTKLLRLCLLATMLFVFYGCNDCKECDDKLSNQTIEIQNLEKELSKTEVELNDYKETFSKETIGLMLNQYKPEQTQKELTPQEKVTYRKRHFDTDNINGNAFKTNVNGGEIYLKFPIYNPSGKTNEIVDVLDVSTKDINAIVVLLNKVNGANTLNNDTSHFLTTTIKIDKVKGLNKSNLSTHKKLKVYIFHDDAFYKDKLIDSFKSCVKDMGNEYDDEPCVLPEPLPSIFDDRKPREQEGDIITGG